MSFPLNQHSADESSAVIAFEDLVDAADGADVGANVEGEGERPGHYFVWGDCYSKLVQGEG